MPVTTRIIVFSVVDPYKPSFATVAGRVATPKLYCPCFFIAPLHAEAHAKLKEDLERREGSTEATTSFQDGRYKETPIRIEKNVKWQSKY